jgi:hypothetical protein
MSLLLFLAGAGVLTLAWPVRQFLRGRRREIDPLRSAAVAALAKSCALVGAGLAGTFAGVLARAVAEWASPAFHGRALLAGAGVLAAVWLSVAGQVGQLWCRLPPSSPDEPAC